MGRGRTRDLGGLSPSHCRPTQRLAARQGELLASLSAGTNLLLKIELSLGFPRQELSLRVENPEAELVGPG
jgi:hypothetical protein